MIPTDQTPNSVEATPDTEQPTPDVIRVFDLNANGWRSFKVANVTKFDTE
jgi:hypothetical protein